ncbi:uncharacterized protein LOC124167047 [Ischnura elegans]|uniref:uncharacterized protein LOC124167047 n=1 Tax=Ischnura elegans TaxID=197161 RepID=UPI001ED89D69|nr:uncharacterized protein LOC124167047 [Ischnura elegans]XP_046400775.1 uncharacterized protein LOC124167047 [Ischnura elegans]XP_046400776.1 uncharacterized protein LOC124167047 [Ischnura elegans]XP_046400777.1 uncharacterized protein LOC124167047 [Ischnura elegans]
MNNRHFADENPFGQDFAASSFANNSFVPSTALDPNSVTACAAQWSPFAPGYIFPQPPPFYGQDGQIYNQYIPSTNQQPFFPENNQHLQYQSNPALGFPLQPSELQRFSPFHQISPPHNNFGQDAGSLTTPVQGQYPFNHQMQNNVLGQNVFPLTSNREFYPQHPVQRNAIPLHNSMFLPSIRHCISLAPLDERTGAPHDDQGYHEFVAGMQGQLQSTAAEKQTPVSPESHPHVFANQSCTIGQAPGVFHVEVPFPDPGNCSLQIFDINCNFSETNQTCKVVFYLENSVHGTNRNLIARVSTNLNVNERQRKEDELLNNSQVYLPTINENTAEAAPQHSKAILSSENHQLTAPPAKNEVNGRSSSQQSLPTETSNSESKSSSQQSLPTDSSNAESKSSTQQSLPTETSNEESKSSSQQLLPTETSKTESGPSNENRNEKVN